MRLYGQLPAGAVPVSTPAPESAAGPAALLGLYEVAGSDGAALPGAVRDGGDHQQRAGDLFRPLHYPAGPAAVVSGAGRWKKLKHF